MSPASRRSQSSAGIMRGTRPSRRPRTLFRRRRWPDAIFVGSDYMAFVVMDYIRFEVGLRIPEDVAIAGL